MSKQSVLNILMDKPVAYHPDVARVCGGVKAGIFFSQLLYWTGKESRKDKFIWKTQQEIEEETALSRREQDGARKELKRRGFMEEKLDGVPARLHYKLNTEAFYEELEKYYVMHQSAKLDCTKAPNLIAPKRQTIPENTTENTTDIAAGAAGEVFSAYENNIGMLSPILSEKIGESIDTYPHQWILDAIQEAATHNGRSWSYIEAILKRWQANGRVPQGKASGKPNPNGNSGLPSWLPAHEDLPAPSWEF